MTTKTEPFYGDFDGIPSRYDADEAWVFHRNKKSWVEINHASHGNAAYELTKADFDYLFPNLPPLPPEAFQSSPTASKGTAREKYMKEISENPKWEEAPKSGQAFGIVGARKPDGG